jgi:3-oxoacyl-[acyl-carrier-protein] synthase-3
MAASVEDWNAHLLSRVARVQQQLGYEPDDTVQPDARFADLLDSMGMVEFLALVARDCGAAPAVIEEAAARRFGTVAQLAEALAAAGLAPTAAPWRRVARLSPDRTPTGGPPVATRACWLAATAVRVPDTVEPSALLDAAVQRPVGWLERHAGIRARRVWAGQDALAAAADAGREALDRSGVLSEEVGALLVASEAPPQLLGLAAALHHRLGLRPGAAAVEVGGACTGFLAAVRLAQGLIGRLGGVLVLTVEAPSRFLEVRPGPAGEAAALFGDAAAAAVLTAESTGVDAVPVDEVLLGADGSAADLIRVERNAVGVEVHLEGRAVAGRAVRAMADLVREVSGCRGLSPADLAGVVAHGGNGRMPALVARELGLPVEQIWSATAEFGNLGAAALPVAWARRATRPRGPVAWAAAGAGMTWAGTLTGP